MDTHSVFQEVKSWKRPFHFLLSKVANFYLKILPKVEVIGISGSVGKTLTQNAVYSVLSEKFRVVVGDENLDPTFRIPQTILKTRPWDQKIILEYGVEHPLDMDYYLKIVKPNIAIITKITPTHLKYFQSEEGVFFEKSKLIYSLSSKDTAILNSDDHNSYKLVPKTKAAILWFGKTAKNSVKISHFAQDTNGSKFRLNYKGQKASISWKVVGSHQLLSAYIASVIGLHNGFTLKQIANGLSKTKQPAHRLNLVKNDKQVILDDTYNSSPSALIESAKTLLDLGKKKTKVAILGEMRDLGKQSNKLHHYVGTKLANKKINYLLTIGKRAKIIATAAKNKGFKGKIFYPRNTKEATDTLKKLKLDKALILVKGSRHEHLERIVFWLQGKSTQVTCYHCGDLK